MSIYIAITKTKNWKWLRTFEPNKDKPKHRLTTIGNALEYPPNKHLMTISLGCMFHIACFGWNDFVIRWKKRYPPSR